MKIFNCKTEKITPTDVPIEDLSFDKFIIDRIEFLKTYKNYEPQINKAISLITKSLKNKGKIFICDNYGISNLVSTSFMVKYEMARKPIPVIDLTYGFAIANEFGLHNVFSRQLKALGDKGDTLIAISNGVNIEHALREASDKKMNIIYFSGDATNKYDAFEIKIEGTELKLIHEMQILMLHYICKNITTTC